MISFICYSGNPFRTANQQLSPAEPRKTWRRPGCRLNLRIHWTLLGLQNLILTSDFHGNPPHGT